MTRQLLPVFAARALSDKIRLSIPLWVIVKFGFCRRSTPYVNAAPNVPRPAFLGILVLRFRIRQPIHFCNTVQVLL
jgi:hypothetical protein